MKFLVGIPAFVAAAVAAVLFFGYAVPYMAHHQTRMSDHEIVIGRVTGFEVATTFVRDQRTGDERLTLHAQAPFASYEYMEIEYSRACSCIHRIYRADVYLMYRTVGNRVVRVVFGEAFDHEEVVPFEQVREEFDEAQEMLADFRSRHAQLLL